MRVREIMKIPLTLFLIVAIPAISGQNPKEPAQVLRGRVVRVTGRSLAPVANAGVTLVENGKAVTTNSAGNFLMPLPDYLRPGDSAQFDINRPGYRVYEPIEGRIRIPRQLQLDVVVIKLLPKGSPKFLTHDQLVAMMEAFAGRAKEQISSANRPKPVPDWSPYLKDWAVQHGFGIEQVKEELDRWVDEVEHSGRSAHEAGLGALYKKRFKEAGNLLEDSAGQSEDSWVKTGRGEAELYEKTINDYELAADAYFYDYNFAKAIKLYEKARSNIDPQRSPQLWARTVIDSGRVRYMSAVRGGGTESDLKQAQADIDRALGVGELTQIERGVAECLLGDVLRELAQRSTKEQVRAYLDTAMALLREAVRLLTLDESRYRLSAAENSLGNVLADLAARSEGKESFDYRNQAASLYRKAVQVSGDPGDMAAAYNNLVAVLTRLGERTEGEQSKAYLLEARAAYAAALKLAPREHRPAEWALIQTNFGMLLCGLARRTEGTDAVQYLQDGLAALRSAVQENTRERMPLPWAVARGNIGVLLVELGKRSGKAQALDCFSDALNDFRMAMEIETRERYPESWAQMRNNLGEAIREIAKRTDGIQAWVLLQQAVAIHQYNLQILTRKDRAGDWAETQRNLGETFRELASRTQSAKPLDYFDRATTAFLNALDVMTETSFPDEWAEAMQGLALTYEKTKNWNEALLCYEQLLRHNPASAELRNKVEDLRRQK